MAEPLPSKAAREPLRAGDLDSSRTLSGRGLYHEDHDLLRDRIAAQGGTLTTGSLIITTDIYGFRSSGDLMLAPFRGASSDEPTYNIRYGTVVGSHPITNGLTEFAVGTPLGLVPAPDMQVLGIHGPEGLVIAMVLDPGFANSGLGEVAMFGDHNMFDDFSLPRNQQLADQLIAWAIPEPSTSVLLALGLGLLGVRRQAW